MSGNDIYESLDEVGRLVVSIERMNINNMAPIHGVAEAPTLGIDESMDYAQVKKRKKSKVVTQRPS